MAEVPLVNQFYSRGIGFGIKLTLHLIIVSSPLLTMTFDMVKLI